MKPIEVRVPHRLDRAEVRRRLETGIERASSEFGDRVTRIDATWEGEDRLGVVVDVMGMSISSEIAVEPDVLVVQLALPGMAGLFAGRIRSGIEEKLGGLLAAPA